MCECARERKFESSVAELGRANAILVGLHASRGLLAIYTYRRWAFKMNKHVGYKRDYAICCVIDKLVCRIVIARLYALLFFFVVVVCFFAFFFLFSIFWTTDNFLVSTKETPNHLTYWNVSHFVWFVIVLQKGVKWTREKMVNWISLDWIRVRNGL